jgi:hypothetical protein
LGKTLKLIWKKGLFVKTITVDGGMMLKDYVQLQGRAHRIRKRSNHVTIVLGSIITHKQFNKDGTKDKSIGNRLGIIRGWDSNWYGGNDYGDKLAEDHKIRSISMLVYQKLVYQK